VAVTLDEGRFSAACLIPSVTSQFNEFRDAEVIAIDVPIGFGPRDADQAARNYLRGSASTVFATASRAILETPFRSGLGVSAQAHSLAPRILHVTALAERDRRFHEVHPEVCFRAMNDGASLGSRKKSAAGALLRIQLLQRAGIELGDLGAAGEAPLDDVVDAAAAAWTADRISRGIARSLPDPPPVVDGRAIAIWF
jgi:predicted RNase H-like nuclease